MKGESVATLRVAKRPAVKIAVLADRAVYVEVKFQRAIVARLAAAKARKEAFE